MKRLRKSRKRGYEGWAARWQHLPAAPFPGAPLIFSNIYKNHIVLGVVGFLVKSSERAEWM